MSRSESRASNPVPWLVGVFFLSVLTVECVVWSRSSDARARGDAERLGSYVGIDLESLDSIGSKKLDQAICAVIPGRRLRDPQRLLDLLDYQPRAVWRLEGQAVPARLVLFEVDPTVDHPGSTRIRLHTFDERGTLLSMTAFTTGHRTYMRGFELKRIPVSSYPVLEISTGLGPGPGANLGGPNPSRQVYALVDDQWRLLRLEADGQVIAASYYVKHFRAGSDLRPRDLPEVENALQSSDPGVVLTMLTWLGGFHQAPPPGEDSRQYEDAKDVAFHREAMQSPKIRERLQELAESETLWVREGAKLILER